MEKNNILNNSFYLYPKSKSHKITCKKNDNIKICELNSKCSELEFNITLNKFSLISNNNTIDNKEKLGYIGCIGSIYKNSKFNINIKNYDIIVFILILIIIIILYFGAKK